MNLGGGELVYLLVVLCFVGLAPYITWRRGGSKTRVIVAFLVSLFPYGGFIIGLIIALKTKRPSSTVGLTPEQAAAVSRSFREGGREAAVQEAAAIQEEQRTVLLAAGIDVTKIGPTIGGEIPWLDVVRQVFRVTEFDRGSTTIVNDKVVNHNPLKPYGHLIVESPILNQAARLPIIHKHDFWQAASVFDDPQFVPVIEHDELLVTYAPRKVLKNGFAGDPSHCLHYVLVPLGTLARYYEVDGDLHMRKPAPEKLFGTFIYEGQVGVGLNKTPAI